MSKRKINSISDLKPGDQITWLEVDQRPSHDLESMSVPSVPHYAIVLSTSSYLKVIQETRKAVCTGKLEREPKDLKVIDYPPDKCFPPTFTIAFAKHLESKYHSYEPPFDIYEMFYNPFPNGYYGDSDSSFEGSHNEPVMCYTEGGTGDCDWMYWCPCRSFAKTVKKGYSYDLEEYVDKLRAENADIPESVLKVLSADNDSDSYGEPVQ